MTDNRIKEIENTWVPMPDGIRLSARIWMPDDAETSPVPCILEYIPYRKRDFTSQRDEGMHPYFASRGYACIRVDMRGAGDSEGLLMDEYLPQEQRDGVAVIAWIAAQPWCDGNVGMIGISWGGITQMQIAAYTPPALKAIMPVGASLDRYYDDGGYFAGAYSGETIGWGAVMFAINTFPPDPAVVGKHSWRELWLRRLREAPLFLSIWLHHPTRDDYWLQGTSLDRLNDIKCPIYVISGWNDCWPNTVLRMLKRRRTQVWGMSGVWGHCFPHRAFPGPGVNFLDEAVRFWDRFLKGHENRFEQTSPLTAYIQTHVPADPRHEQRPGYWVAEATWPSTNVSSQNWYWGKGQLAPTPLSGDYDSICSGVQTGFCSRDYMPIPQIPELEQMPTDQTLDDDESMVYDSKELDHAMVIMGTPRARLRIKSDYDAGLVAVRLSDVAPDGAVSSITYGVLNLAQRNGRESFAAVKPNQFYDVQVRLNDIAHEIQPGHKLRLSISSNFFPMAWPLPYQCTMTLDSRDCSLLLPVRQIPAEELPVPETCHQPPVVADSNTYQELTAGQHNKKIERGATHTMMQISSIGATAYHRSTGWRYGKDNRECFYVDNKNPLKTTATYDTTAYFQREGFDVRSENKMTVSCDEKDFIITARTVVYLNQEVFFERSYDERIGRHIF